MKGAGRCSILNVVVVIDGREAIPVRAIPLLTNWKFLSPDVLAQVLAGHGVDRTFVFGDLQAFHLQNGKVRPIPKDWWESWPARELQALSEKIGATELSHDVGYQQWRDESLPLLPAGSFVWKNEFVELHGRNWDNRFRTLSCANLDEDEDEKSPPIDSKHAAFIRQALEILDKWREPDFSPFIRPALGAVVMEGLEPQQAATLGLMRASRAEPPDASERAMAERKVKMAALLEQMKSAVYRQASAEADEAERQSENAANELYRAKALLENPSALGSVKGLKDAESEVASRQKKVDAIAERNRVMRGDIFPEPPPEPVPTESASDDVKLAKAGPVDEKPWMAIDLSDPKAEQPWYTPARYFARQLVIADSTLLVKKLVLADKVTRSLSGVGIYKRGGKKPHDAATVLKAFANVPLG